MTELEGFLEWEARYQRALADRPAGWPRGSAFQSTIDEKVWVAVQTYRRKGPTAPEQAPHREVGYLVGCSHTGVKQVRWRLRRAGQL